MAEKEIHGGDTLAEVIKEKKRSFSELSFPEKIQFIFDYYKWQIFIALFVVIVSVSLINNYVNNNQKDQLYGVGLNIVQDTEPGDRMVSDYKEYSSMDLDHYKFTYEHSLFMGREIGIDTQTDYAAIVKMTTLSAAQQLDFLITNDYAFEYYANRGSFVNLKEVLPEDLYSRLEADGRIIYGEVLPDEDSEEESIEPYPMAVDLTGLEFLETYQIQAYSSEIHDDSSVYFSLMATSKRTEEGVNFLRFILGEEYVPAESDSAGNEISE